MSATDMTPGQHAALFFLQMFVILAACRAMGWLARRVGQPQVVGEMIAGVLLGPSLFGLLLPAWQQRLFPADSLKVLYVGAQLGIALYMFLVGLDTRTELVVRRLRSAAAVSISGIVVPFALGVALALWLTTLPGLFSPEARRFDACVFLGASMAITAFPVLARIIEERKLSGTPLGSLTLAAGAVDDAAAWCALAVVLASFGGGPEVAIRAIVGGFAYAAIVLTLGRRILARLGTAAERLGGVTPPILGVTLLLLMLGAFAMEKAGLHAVFGGYVLGLAMPRGAFAREMRAQLEPFAVTALLPMFFAFSGLTTRLDLMNSFEMGGVVVAVLAVACLGKGVACWAAARWSGEDHRTAMAVGTLMNARGVMELILLSIGLQHGLILPGLFSALVVMAVVTTFMATPLFELVYGRHARASGRFGEAR